MLQLATKVIFQKSRGFSMLSFKVLLNDLHFLFDSTINSKL